ncbi:hypothetical protein B0H19DRAFT_1252431 [Mycena capillaripes]|nr:hypothetical protein B0H19DRAFT_1252431 [Mycena capillaripes]
MENDAPPPETDVLARLRTEEFKSLELEAEVARLRLKNTHNIQDIVAAQAECSEYKMRCERAEREVGELRAKYEGLKRRFSPNLNLKASFRKHEPDAESGERREGDLKAVLPSESPLASPPASTSKLPDTNSKLGEPIVRKASASSTDGREIPWPQSPVVPSPFIPSSNDPRKRTKLDANIPSFPDLPFSSSTPSIAPANYSPSIPARDPSDSPALLNDPTKRFNPRTPNPPLPQRPTGTPFPPTPPPGFSINFTGTGPDQGWPRRPSQSGSGSSPIRVRIAFSLVCLAGAK